MNFVREIKNYQTSKDYAALYALAKSQSVVCIIDNASKLMDGTKHVCRDICHTSFHTGNHGDITQLSVRGIGYVWAENEKEFVGQCVSGNVEWIVPHNIESKLKESQ